MLYLLGIISMASSSVSQGSKDQGYGQIPTSLRRSGPGQLTPARSLRAFASRVPPCLFIVRGLQGKWEDQDYGQILTSLRQSGLGRFAPAKSQTAFARWVPPCLFSSAPEFQGVAGYGMERVEVRVQQLCLYWSLPSVRPC